MDLMATSDLAVHNITMPHAAGIQPHAD